MTRFYYRGDKRRDSLKSLFQTWHQILDSYDRKLDEDDDSLTWHIERTHIGILASAAYNRSRLVLEEYSTQKRKGRSKPGRKGSSV